MKNLTTQNALTQVTSAATSIIAFLISLFQCALKLGTVIYRVY